MYIRNGMRSKAFTLVELLLALLVMAILMFIAANFYVNVRENAKVVAAVSRVNSIVVASYAWRDGVKQSDFCGLATPSHCSNPIAIQKLINLRLLNPQEAQSPWPDPIAQAILSPSQNPRYITISYQAIPETVCRKLVNNLKDKVVKINNQAQTGCSESPQGAVWYGVF